MELGIKFKPLATIYNLWRHYPPPPLTFLYPSRSYVAPERQSLAFLQSFHNMPGGVRPQGICICHVLIAIPWPGCPLALDGQPLLSIVLQSTYCFLRSISLPLNLEYFHAYLQPKHSFKFHHLSITLLSI